MHVYLDLNVFDRAEKLDRLEVPERAYYDKLVRLIQDKKVRTAYSNAHLNDLFRGYQKNPGYTSGHLNHIKKLTGELCICQYWGNAKATWHYRDIFQFFQEKQQEWDDGPADFDDFVKEYIDLSPEVSLIYEMYRRIPLPGNFKDGYSDPLFGVMFPLSKNQPNYYALQADIYNFQCRLKSDFGLYKSFRSKLLNGLNKLKNNKEFLKVINKDAPDLPKHLEIQTIFDIYTPENKTSENVLYDRVLDAYFKFDLSGYKSDGHYNNMFDDGLHTFYAAHFDCFITNDDRCKYKAEKTYERLKLKTRVIKIDQIDEICNL